MLTPMKAIRAKCLDCCLGSFREVRLCTCEKCPLFPYLFGKRPKGYSDTAEGIDGEKYQASPVVLKDAEV